MSKTRQLLEQYLLGEYIIPMTWKNCLNSREDFIILLKGWIQMTSSESIGDLNTGVGVRPLIKLRIGDRRYEVNADTKREGVQIFLENEKKGNTWFHSDKNRVSNALNGGHIKNFHMYKK